MNTAMEQQLRRLLLQRLESLQHAGVRDLPRRARGPSEPDSATTASNAVPAATWSTEAGPTESVPAATHVVVSSQSAPLLPSDGEMTSRTVLSRQQRIEGLDRVRRDVVACERCPELASTRTQTVFGVGNPMARLVFLGEAPGADEDRQGEPFVGRAGQLLNKIIEVCTLDRQKVYILNILKCRPPGNRTPEPREAANCREFLLRQLEAIQPEYICCLGAVAAQNLLEITTPIGQLRGRFHRFQQIKVMATYHPAYLLRNPSAKRATWDDMRMLMSDMGIKLPES
jgi:uracil-DNA glycosylase family 4